MSSDPGTSPRSSLASSPISSRVRRHALIHGRRLLAGATMATVLAAIVALFPLHLYAAGSFVGVKSYYLGLGDSLAFGYEPNLDWSHGYVQQWNTDLKTHNSKLALTNYGCNGEKTTTFIKGGCPYAYALHNYYLGAQLSAAVKFIKGHAGQVSPVSLDMGANDVLPDINSSTCVVASTWESDLATMDANLSGTILPQLINALKNTSGQMTGDLVMMNYYNPFQAQCPADTQYVTELNAHLANDWTVGWQNAGFAAAPYALADVFTAFGGTATQNDCTYTWMCSSHHDIHASGGQSGEPGNGYSVIAGAFKSLTGY
jgi:lysophospholipase L1-like esterase